MKLKELVNKIIIQEMKNLKEDYAIIIDNGSSDISAKEIAEIFKGLKYSIQNNASNAFSAIKEIQKNVFLIVGFSINKDAEYSIKFTVDNSSDRSRSSAVPFNDLNNSLRKFTIGNEFSSQDDLFMRLDKGRIASVLKNKILIVENFVKESTKIK